MTAVQSTLPADAAAGVPWTEAGELEVLTFDLEGEVFALEAKLVQEILDLPAVTAVPGASPLVGGVINFRGKVIPFADLRVAFGMEAAADGIDTRVVVIQFDFAGEPTLVGLRADRVNEVATLAATASEPAPSVGLTWRPELIRCLVKRKGDLVVLPNLTAIFALHGDWSVSRKLAS